METPRIDGLRVKLTVGSGVSGTVYTADDESGTQLSVKVFQGMSINRQLLSKATARLEHGGWPKGVMPVISANFDGRPALRVTQSYFDDGGIPSSLQHRLAQFPAAHSWDLVRELTQALASMHGRQVAHGNIKPGNVFFAESGELLLTDWAVGNMPGISHLEYTDAFLYQPPEQLLQPEGYLDEAGYRWDVFAFGVLSFRLLTGTFPRCEETFCMVAPAAGETRRDGIIADTQKIAQNLALHARFSWPDEPQNVREAQYRELINQCLTLDPLTRPSSMVEVLHRFEDIDQRNDAEEHRDLLLDQRRRADRRSWMWTMAAGVLLGIGALLGFLWLNTARLLSNEKEDRATELKDLRETTRLAVEGKQSADELRTKEVSAAETAQKTAEDTLKSERAIWLARIESARDTGDRLFAWALEKGNRNLPPLDGRETRLKRLESYYQTFISEHEKSPDLAEESARAKLQLAEISLALGQAEVAATRLQEALAALKPLETNGSWDMRIATDRLLLALLWQQMGDARSAQAFTEARTALSEVKDPKADQDRLKQLRAILDYHEAKNFAEKADDAKALEQLMNATKQLNELADARPDASILRSELANCYLSSATILEGMGNLGDARETRALAVNEIQAQLKANPKDFALRLDLAGTYGAMAEASMLAGDISSADQLSKDAITLLDKLIQEQPENAQVASRLASQYFITASLLTDQGQATKALEIVERGIKLLVSHVTGEKSDALAQFNLGRLLWEKAHIIGAEKDHKEGFALYQQALDMLSKLSDKDHGYLRAENVKRFVGFIHADMAHAAQLDKNFPQAKTSWAASIKVWEELLVLRPKNEEYEGLLDWAKGRLKDL